LLHKNKEWLGIDVGKVIEIIKKVIEIYQAYIKHSKFKKIGYLTSLFCDRVLDR